MAEYIVGRNSVLEYLKSEKTADKLYVTQGEKKGSILKIISLAKQKKIPTVTCDVQKLQQIAQGKNHQGVALLAQDFVYMPFELMLEKALSKKKDPIFVLCDELEDPHNLGAIIRTAECVGADGVIIPKHRSVSVTAIVHKTSSGATEYMPISRVNNLKYVIEQLKKNNIWVYGTSADAQSSLWQCDYSGGCAIVVGNEGRGMSKSLKEACDVLVSIPLSGRIDSLNASVATAIMLYEIKRQRKL